MHVPCHSEKVPFEYLVFKLVQLGIKVVEAVGAVNAKCGWFVTFLNAETSGDVILSQAIVTVEL